MSTLHQKFPSIDPSVILIILESTNYNEAAASKQLEEMEKEAELERLRAATLQQPPPRSVVQDDQGNIRVTIRQDSPKIDEEAILISLIDKFPSVDAIVVKLILEENNYDQTKSLKALEQMSNETIQHYQDEINEIDKAEAIKQQNEILNSFPVVIIQDPVMAPRLSGNAKIPAPVPVPAAVPASVSAEYQVPIETQKKVETPSLQAQNDMVLEEEYEEPIFVNSLQARKAANKRKEGRKKGGLTKGQLEKVYSEEIEFLLIMFDDLARDQLLQAFIDNEYNVMETVDALVLNVISVMDQSAHELSVEEIVTEDLVTLIEMFPDIEIDILHQCYENEKDLIKAIQKILTRDFKEQIPKTKGIEYLSKEDLVNHHKKNPKNPKKPKGVEIPLYPNTQPEPTLHPTKPNKRASGGPHLPQPVTTPASFWAPSRVRETQPNSMSNQIKLNQLIEKYPMLDQEELKIVFYENHCNFEKTDGAIEALYFDKQPKKQVIEKTSEKPIIQPNQPKVKPGESYWDPSVPRNEPLMPAPTPVRQPHGDHHAMYQKMTFEELTAEANAYAKLRNQCFIEASRAYVAGNPKAAKDLSVQGKEYGERIIVIRGYASRTKTQDIRANSRNQGKITIDLHGFLVQDALDLLERLFAYYKDQGKPLEVITGRGNHSMGGHAKIKPAVIQFLNENGYKYSAAGEGALTVHLK